MTEKTYTVDGRAHSLTLEQAVTLKAFGHTVVEMPDPQLFARRLGTAPGWSGEESALELHGCSDGTLRLEAETMGDTVGLTLDRAEVVKLRDALSEWLTLPRMFAAEVTANSPEPERGVEYLDAQGDVWTYGTHESFVPWTSGWFCYEEEDGDILCGPYSWAAVTSNYRHAGAFPWRAM